MTVGSGNYKISTFDHENRHHFYYGWNGCFRAFI